MRSNWQPNRIEHRALDILRAAAKIRRYVDGMSRPEFLEDERTQDAVARQILVIAEACDKIAAIEQKAGSPLPNRLEARYPEIPWREIRDMGIRIRHVYGTIDPEMIWSVATMSDDLKNLEAVLKKAFPG